MQMMDNARRGVIQDIVTLAELWHEVGLSVATRNMRISYNIYRQRWHRNSSRETSSPFSMDILMFRLFQHRPTIPKPQTPQEVVSIALRPLIEHISPSLPFVNLKTSSPALIRKSLSLKVGYRGANPNCATWYIYLVHFLLRYAHCTWRFHHA